jgi:hypothetical protein
MYLFTEGKYEAGKRISNTTNDVWNKLVGNPIGKTTSIATNHAKSLFGKNTSDEPINISTNKNSTDSENSSIKNGVTSDSNHNDSLNNNESISKNNIHGNSNSKSFMGKGGILGFGAGLAHQFGMTGGDIGANMSFIGQEVGATWNQFKNDVSNHGIIQATGNQIGDVIAGESARIEANKAFAAGNTMQGYSIAGAGVIDNVVGLASGIVNKRVFKKYKCGAVSEIWTL